MLVPMRPFSNQLSLTYADEQEDDLTWDNYTFRQHQFSRATALTMASIRAAIWMIKIYA